MHPTYLIIARFPSSVAVHVSDPTPSETELLLTDRTLVRSCVGLHVGGEGRRMIEPFLTYLTPVRFNSCVDSHMDGETKRLVK